jgi:hypothetical protein
MRDLRPSILAPAAVFFLVGLASAQTASTPTSTSAASPRVPEPALAVPAPPGLADSLVGEAREDYAAARVLFAAGDYARALLRFESAYETSHDPRLLWNAAVCQKAMGHYVKAMGLVRRYLDSGSPLILPDAARSARAFVAAAESQTARLDVVSNEPDAIVSVDGESVGSTPMRAPLLVDRGVHTVTVTKNGFAELSTQISVTDSQDVRLQVPLAPIAPVAPVAAQLHEGRVAVHARPGDAIAVDGRVVAGESWEGTLPSGGHSVRVTAPGDRPFQVDVLVQDGQTRTLDVKLEPDRARAAGVPAWVWIVGGTVLAASATTAGYFLLKTADESSPTMGSIATVRAPLH